MQMSKRTLWRVLGILIVFSLLLSDGRAQVPRLKTVESPESGTPLLRSDGLIATHWDQDYPYNQLCPRDPVNGNSYSYAGCPAVAMAQIINYLRTTQNTRFSDSDDYAHHYLGRDFDIDDDWETLQFPSFPQLNGLLDSVDAFAVDQAYDAYQRFGFTDCMLFREPDSLMYATLISNLQAGYPAHLAVENPEGTVGHNVVVDGYRASDGKFHINFGYGGYLDDWYGIPDPDFYYGMTKVEGIILNIIPTQTAVQEYSRPQPLEIFPNPVSDVLYIKNLPCAVVDYSIFNSVGQTVASGSSSGTIPVTALDQGLYFLQIKSEKGWRTVKFVVR